ncbi:MAG TPA: hypothetical protein VLF91_03370 [Candidatus Saccharimonadales bacterium]|nr:hypothetical protein [Candidatus Saccharimonadales bacterium]
MKIDVNHTSDDKPKAKAAPTKTSGKVFDVRRPGKAPATPTSRPVVASHKPSAAQSQTAVSGVGEREALLVHHESTLAAPKVAAEAAPAPETVAMESPAPALISSPESDPVITEAAEQLATDELQQSVTAALAQPKPKPEAASADTANMPATAPEAGQQPVTNQLLAAASEAMAEDEPQPLPLSASQDLRLDDAGHPHILRTVLLVLLLLGLLAVVADVLLDSGVLTLAVPHTHFFGL